MWTLSQAVKAASILAAIVCAQLDGSDSSNGNSSNGAITSTTMTSTSSTYTTSTSMTTIPSPTLSPSPSPTPSPTPSPNASHVLWPLQNCSAGNVSCGCDPLWEVRCTDSSDGHNYCADRLTGCPVSCAPDQQICYMPSFTSSGHIDFSAPPNQSCHAQGAPCPCNLQHQELCNSNNPSEAYCQTTAEGTCPLSCNSSQRMCFTAVYTSNGTEDFSQPYNEFCVGSSEPCPCAAQWEHRCTGAYGTWCQLATEACPLNCGQFHTCYDYATNNESCATSQGCPCRSDQVTCQVGGQNECYESGAYPGDGCPLVCSNGTMLCFTYGFDSAGNLNETAQCIAENRDLLCPVQCDTTSSRKCGSGEMAFCAPMAETCPLECSADQEEIYVDNFDTNGQIVSTNESCRSPGANLACGTNAVRCEADGFQYCEATAFGCPVVCGATQKECFPISFTAAGDVDTTVHSQVTCVNASQSCPCGSNAKRCTFTDSFNLTEEFCIPTTETCPVTCTAAEKICFIQNYNASGYPVSFSEICVPAAQDCRCGTGAKSCSDESGEKFCLALRDFWTNTPQNCPVICTASQEYCFVNNFRSNGSFLSVQEKCVPIGGTCDCSTGQNALTCVRSEFGENWTECIPANGGYCPTICSPGQVTCEEVVDYTAAGTFLGTRRPPQSCAASYADCSCGLNSKMCRYSDFAWCIPRTESCPVICVAGQQTCSLNDYDTSGNVVSEREICVAENVTCPCGRNAAICAGDGVCYPQRELSTFCSCTSSQKTCTVEDFSATDGTPINFNTVCVPKGAKCPCGQNSLRCPDPNDASSNFCVPKASRDGRVSCPSPCTPAQESTNETCLRTNMNQAGDVLSETISCVVRGSCTPGTKMKKCPQGGVIHSAAQCKNLYGNSTRNALPASQKQSTQIQIALSGGGGARGALAAAGQLRNQLQLPPQLEVKVALKTTSGSTSSRRLSAARTTAIIEIQNLGATAVSPQAAAGQTKRMLASGQLNSALSSIGQVNTNIKPTVSTKLTTVRSRDVVANPTPSPTPTPLPTPSPTPSPSPVSTGNVDSADRVVLSALSFALCIAQLV